MEERKWMRERERERERGERERESERKMREASVRSGQVGEEGRIFKAGSTV